MSMFNRRSSSGFTLIELIITVAIVAILARIAYASYTESVNRAKRSQAQTAIISLAQAMERYYTKCNSYNSTTSPCTTTIGTANAPTIFPANVPATGTAYYTLSLAVPNPNTYTITATRAGVMSNDACGDFTFASSGAKGLVNNTKAVADCWK